MKEISENRDIDTPEKRALLKTRANRVFQSVTEVCVQNRESLTSVLGNVCIQGPSSPRGGHDMVTEKRGVKSTFKELLSEETWQQYHSSMRAPDWVLLYFKIKTHISDSTWQTAINFTNLGRTGVRFNNYVYVIMNTKCIALQLHTVEPILSTFS